MDHTSVASILESYIPYVERIIDGASSTSSSGGRRKGRFVVQKAHIFVKYPSSTPCYDDPRHGINQILDIDDGSFHRLETIYLCAVENAIYRKKSFFCVQVDALDLLTRHLPSTLGKRRSTAVNYFGQLSPRCLGDTSGGIEPSPAQKITGVRFHSRDKKYVAEVWPPSSKGKKVHLGQFSTQPEAVRARDVGCYLYHRDKERMYYEDTPQRISTLLTSTGCNAEDELSKFAGLDEGEKEKIVKEVAKSIAKEQAEKLSSTHPRHPKTMRTSMRTDISQNRVHITEQTAALESSEFEPRRCAFEQREIRETTSGFSDSWINEDGGTLTTDTQQSWLSGIEEWMGSVILEGPSTASTVQHRSPDELQIDQMEKPLEVSTEASESGASDQVPAMILELMEEQDMCQRSVEHVAGHPLTNLETFGSMDSALSMTYHSMNLAASPSQVGSPSDGYSLWESGAQSMALDGLGSLS